MVGPSAPFPLIDTLHRMHKGVTEALSASYVEAAAVCLNDAGDPPAHLTVQADGKAHERYLASWPTPTDRIRRSWNNLEDATRDGAYGVALAASECCLGYVAVRRAETKTGADYYLSSMAGSVEADDADLDLEGTLRLEVSGMLRCQTEAALARRVRQKQRQTERGTSSLPAIVGVVAFDLRRIVLRQSQ